MPAPHRPDTTPGPPDPGTVPSWRTRAVASTPPLGRPLAPPPADLGHVGPYRLVEVLGQGGMGVVYRGEDPALRRHVAVKVLLPEYAGEPDARERFLREARAQAAVEHDHVVAIHAVGEADGTPYIVMPLLKGRTLAAALARDLRPPLAEVLRVGREVAEGLAAAHEQGLVHRDIKPGNVWLEAPSGRVKILDFGLARVTAEVAASPLTAEGMTVGTVEYMSPEQARGQAVDHRTDLFSLGVVLYQMTTGQLPFRGPNTVATLAALIETTPRPPAALNPDAPPELNALIQRLLAKDRARRPASAGEVAEALRRIAAGSATEALAVPPVGQPPPRARAPKPATKATRADRPRKESKRAKAAPKRRTPTAVWVAVGLVAVLGVAAVGGVVAVAGRAMLGRDKETQVSAVPAGGSNLGPDAGAGGHRAPPEGESGPQGFGPPGGGPGGGRPGGDILGLGRFFAVTLRTDDGTESEFRPGQPRPQGRIAVTALRRPRRGSVEALRELVSGGVPPELSGLRELHLPRPAQMDPAIQEVIAQLPADCRVEWIDVGPPPPP